MNCCRIAGQSPTSDHWAAAASRCRRRQEGAARRSQFTSSAFTGLLQDHGIRISMDGKGCWRDNVFIERVWRSIKYEEVYLHAYETVSAAREGIGRYINFYNTRRPHSSHQARTPDVVYFASLPQPSAEAA